MQTVINRAGTLLHPTDAEMHLERRKRRREGKKAGEGRCRLRVPPHTLRGDLGRCSGCKGAVKCVAVLSSSSQLLGKSKIPVEMQAESLKS